MCQKMLRFSMGLASHLGAHVPMQKLVNDLQCSANEHFLCFTLGGYPAENFQAGSKDLGEFNLESHFSTKRAEDL